VKALVVTAPGGPDVLRVEQRPTPVPVDDQILVRVAAAGVDRADILQRRGHYPAPADSPPDILGMEYAGTVERSGPAAKRFAPGTRVFGLVGGGAQAEFVITRDALALAIPDSVSDVEAGGIPEAYITAHDALFARGSLARGERVLIHAVGSGVGIAALQVAKAWGATVFGTSRTASKLERARALGLDAAIDWDAPFDRAVDVVIDFVGAPYFERNVSVLAPRGRLVQVSTLGGADVQLSLRTLMQKRLTIVGTMLRSRSYEEKVAATNAFARDIVPLLASGAIKVPIDKTFPLDEAAQAHEYISSDKNFGKVVLTIAGT
jgi:NADPH:quinone reductase